MALQVRPASEDVRHSAVAAAAVPASKADNASTPALVVRPVPTLSISAQSHLWSWHDASMATSTQYDSLPKEPAV